MEFDKGLYRLFRASSSKYECVNIHLDSRYYEKYRVYELFPGMSPTKKLYCTIQIERSTQDVTKIKYYYVY